jgi:tetratricopeptide (TPR) repeat protein
MSLRKRTGLGALIVTLAWLAGCTPQAALLMQVLPSNTIPVLLGHLERVDDTNRRRLADFERRADWEGMARFAEENATKDPRNADWRLVAGYAYSQLGRHDEAIRSYGEMVRLAPDDILGWNLLAQSQRSAGRQPQAIRTLEAALQVRRDAAPIWFLLGESNRDLGRLEAALAGYQEAVKLDNRFAQAWFGMGSAYAGLARKQEFDEVVLVLRQLDPALAQALVRSVSAPR